MIRTGEVDVLERGARRGGLHQGVEQGQLLRGGGHSLQRIVAQVQVLQLGLQNMMYFHISKVNFT